MGLLAGPSWSVALVALLAFVQPARDLLLAAIVMTIGTGALGLVNPATHATGLTAPFLLIAAGALLLVLLFLPRTRAHVSDLRVPAWGLPAVTIAAAIAWLAVMLQWDGGLLRLVQAVRESAATVVLPLGAAVLFARSQIRPRRALVLACVLAAIVPAVMVSADFQRRVVRDPLLAEMPELPRVPARLMLIGRAPMRTGGIIRVSPSAQSIATGQADAMDEGGHQQVPTAFTVRTTEGQEEQVAAADLQFVDDRHVLLLRDRAAGLELTLHALGQPLESASASASASELDSESPPRKAPKRTASAPAAPQDSQGSQAPRAGWTLRLPDFAIGRLFLDPRTGRWRVAGHSRRGEWLRVQGVLGNEIVDEARWKRPTDDAGAMPVDTPVDTVLFDGGRTIVAVHYAWPTSWLARLAPTLAVLTARSAADVSLRRIDAGQTTTLADSEADVTCLEPEVNAGQTVCLAFDGLATRIWSIDGERGPLVPVGLLPGAAHAQARGLDGSVLVWWRRRPLIVHPRSPHAIELTSDSVRPSRWHTGAYTPGHLVVTTEGEAGPGLATYQFAVEERPAASPPTRAAADRAMLDGR